MKSVVIGACGHVGLPLSVLMACEGIQTVGIDINEESIKLVETGKAPFKELNLDVYLKNALESKNLTFAKYRSVECVKAIKETDYIVIIIGTPVDSENNPRTEPLLEVFEYLNTFDLSDKNIILRSTVAPGTTEMLFNKLLGNENAPNSMAFCPERVQQGHSLTELQKFPQIIGMQYGYEDVVAAFFERFLEVPIYIMSSKEAELGKLFTNMARYIEFAVANEFQMIADSFGQDGAKILEVFKHQYPRLNIARPGPNVGGPCLFKDGKFLLKNTRGMTLTEMAFQVNEGMPAFIVSKLEPAVIAPKVLILGAAFKAESDDIRNSLSFKLKKLLINEGYDVTIYDPHVKNYDSRNWQIGDFNSVVVMTPHNAFLKLKDEIKYSIVRLIDLWKLFG